MGLLVSVFLPVSLAFIMLTLGLGLTTRDFFDIAKRPGDFFLGAFLQILVIPLVGFALIFIWDIPPELALGVMILAASPGGPTSNLLTAFGKGDVALSVTLTAFSSLVCVVTLPIALSLSYQYLHDDGLEKDFNLIPVAVRLFVMVTMPVVVGVVICEIWPDLAERILPVATKISAVIFVIVLLGAIYAERANLVEYFGQSGLITFALLVTCMTIAHGAAKLFASGQRQQTSITIECGMQNGVLAIAVASNIFGGGLTTVPAITYGLTMYWPVFLVMALGRMGAASK